MTLRDDITQTLTGRPPLATHTIWWPVRDHATTGDVERALGELWEEGLVEGWPSGPWTVSRAGVKNGVQTTRKED